MCSSSLLRQQLSSSSVPSFVSCFSQNGRNVVYKKSHFEFCRDNQLINYSSSNINNNKNKNINNNNNRFICSFASVPLSPWKGTSFAHGGIKRSLTTCPEKGQIIYTPTHEWAEIEEVNVDSKDVRIGISKFARQALGEIAFIESDSEHLDVGFVVKKGDSLAAIETVKSVSEVYSPVPGHVLDINGPLFFESRFDLLDDPESEKGSIGSIRVPDSSGAWWSNMMTADEYNEFCKKESDENK